MEAHNRIMRKICMDMVKGKIMQLKEIYESIIANVTKEGGFVFSGQTLGEAGQFLEEYFKEVTGSPVFEMRSVECRPPEKNLVAVCGTCNDGQVKAEAGFFWQASALMMELRLSFLMDMDMEFFPGRTLRTGEAVKKYRFRMDQKAKVYRSRSGVLREELSYTQFLALFLEGLAGEGACLAEAEVWPVFRGMALTVEEVWEAGIDKRRVRAESDAVLRITDKIEIGGLGIEAVRSDKAYGLALKGSIFFCEKSLPVVLHARENEFVFGIQAKKDDVGELALKDLLQLVDAPFADTIPDYFSVLKNLRLHRLLFFLDSGLGALRAAEIEITSLEAWRFLGVDCFQLRDIHVSFSMSFAPQCTCVAEISGMLSVGSFDIELCGTKEQDGFTFRGQMPQDSELNLKTVVEFFAESFGVPSVSLPIPDILLKFVFVSFSTSEKNGKPFQLSAFVDVRPSDGQDDIAKKLLNIGAQIQLESALQGGVRTYCGNLKGAVEIAGQVFTVAYEFGRQSGSRISAEWKSDTKELSFVTLLAEFQVTDVPDIVRRISIGVNEVSASYDIGKKELSLTLVSRGHGQFSAYIWKDGKNRFQYALELTCIKTLELSDLPVVGRDFKLLDNVRITGIGLSAASAAYGGIRVGAGIRGTVEVGGGRYPFELETQKDTEGNEVADAYADAGETVGLYKWFPVNKNLGIFSFQRIGVTYQKGAVGFLLDASLSASPIGMELLGIGMGFELEKPSNVRFFLSGMGVSYTSRTLVVNGEFTANGDAGYDGALLVKMAGISLYAVGSYQAKSLFAYALLTGKIGGPPAFTVTGIAGGFGYNRSLRLPAVEDVGQFPMIRAAVGGLDKSAMITELERYVTVAYGTNFLAAGVKFNSFQMIDSFVLCTVSFGNRLEIGLLGLSEISVPANTGAAPIAYAQLALKAVCVPDEGIVSVMAELTRESYILSKACHLTGGFAFYLWFGGSHKGDFVITLGGYHPAYRKPEHYPSVPRLGFRWCVTPELTFSGELYFALTPRCLMAGGALDAVYQSGDLRAWFSARVDFLLGWKPFYYEASLYIGLGASYRLFLLFGYVTISAELSADLHIWGPDFSGEARITWFIISFTIRFGHSKNEKKYLVWDEFEKSFLVSGNRNLSADAGLAPQERKIHAVSYTAGLLRQSETEGVFVDPEALRICVRSQVPVTELKVNGKNQEVPPTPLGVLPMGENKRLKSSCKVSVTDSAGRQQDMRSACVRENVPTAMWGLSETGMNGAGLVEQACVGVSLSPIVKQEYNMLPSEGWLHTEDLDFRIDRTFAWNHPKPLSGPDYPQQDTIAAFAGTVDAEGTRKTREEMLSQWRGIGVLFDIDKEKIGLQKLAKRAQDLFTEDIRLQTMV